MNKLQEKLNFKKWWLLNIINYEKYTLDSKKNYITIFLKI